MKGILVPLTQHAKIRKLHQNGSSVDELANTFHLHRATIYHIIKEKKKAMKKRRRPTKHSSIQQLQLQTRLHRNPTESASQLANSIKFPVSDRTIRRELEKVGFHHRRLKPKRVLKKIHQQKRRDFAVTHVTWSPAEWARVIFTDEKRWNLSGNDGYISIWTQSKQNPLEMVETNQRGGLMVWGAITKNGGLSLICMEGKITADSYIDMLENDFFDMVNDQLPDNFIWMHDNAPLHVVMKTKEYLEQKGITSMEWPPMSPDLNLIENV